MIAQAQSGTGKTATFAISILQQVDVEMKATQALVLAPTRELAQQVSRQNLGFCEDMLNCISFCFYFWSVYGSLGDKWFGAVTSVVAANRSPNQNCCIMMKSMRVN